MSYRLSSHVYINLLQVAQAAQELQLLQILEPQRQILDNG
jgi:hypothetical protein